jgi:hypothetical protein
VFELATLAHRPVRRFLHRLSRKQFAPLKKPFFERGEDGRK